MRYYAGEMGFNNDDLEIEKLKKEGWTLLPSFLDINMTLFNKVIFYYRRIISTRRFCGSRVFGAVGTKGLVSP